MRAETGSSVAASGVESRADSDANLGPDKDARVLSERCNPSELSADPSERGGPPHTQHARAERIAGLSGIGGFVRRLERVGNGYGRRSTAGGRAAARAGHGVGTPRSRCSAGQRSASRRSSASSSRGLSAIAAGCIVVLAVRRRRARLAASARTARAALEDEIESRTSELKRALSELEIAQAETVQRLSMAVEFRDEDTGAHIERIGRFSVLLAEHIGMDAEFCERLSHAAPLHDVGKVAIPDAILLKPGPLTPEERAIVETHAEEGHRLVRGSSSSILDMAATIALSHQEKWDGTGYPRGLKGEAIPIEGRIVAVADVFDALTSDRVYRKAFSVEEAIQMMREQRGRHFDPVLLDAFMEVLGRSGPDAREQLRSDPAALVESTLETFATALERGDAEMAEGAIATAIEDGISPTTLHAEVIGPALRRLDVLVGSRARSTPSASTAPTTIIAPRARDALPLHDRRHRADARARAARGRRRATSTRSACRWSTTSSPRPATRRSSTPTSTAERLLRAGREPVARPRRRSAPPVRAAEDRSSIALRELRASHPEHPDRARRPRRRRQPAARARRHAGARADRRVGRSGRRPARAGTASTARRV